MKSCCILLYVTAVPCLDLGIVGGELGSFKGYAVSYWFYASVQEEGSGAQVTQKIFCRIHGQLFLFAFRTEWGAADSCLEGDANLTARFFCGFELWWLCHVSAKNLIAR